MATAVTGTTEIVDGRYDPVDILVYIWNLYDQNSNNGDESLSKHDHFSLSRATKLVYLVDWYNALEYGRQVTSISWYFDSFGPYVDITDNLSNRFQIFYEEKGEGLHKRVRQSVRLSPRSGNAPCVLDSKAKEICSKVVQKTKSMGDLQFIRYVYHTLPVMVTEKYSTIELEKIAKNTSEEQREYILKP